MRIRTLLPLVGAALLGFAPRATSAQEALSVDELRGMSIDELAELEVTSVSRQAEPLSGAAAAIFVITSEDIRRYGVRSLPEALRLAPSLQVMRLDALSHAISARGFNSSSASNKLLVLIDGRTVYSPLHSGVFWDAQDVMLADVERIEVISGPGGTLWGANAVNGVINIITRSAADADTEGLLVTGTYGDVDYDGAARYGVRAGDALAVRAYGKGFERGNSINASGVDHLDTWHRFQGGLRGEWSGDADVLTVQGDLYESHVTGHKDLFPEVNSEVSGGDVMARWSRSLSPTSSLEVQAYYDWTRRDQRPIVAEDVDTYDIEAQHRFMLGSRHELIWGGGYRILDDRFVDLGAFAMAQEDSRRRLASLFIQDEIRLSESFTLTAGTKLEDHTYTDLEYMPNARLAWRASDAALIWGAVSRAVRTPSRIDRELQLPGLLVPAPDFRSETLLAYELGYRGQPRSDLVVSVSGFFNKYDHLRTTELSSGGVPPLFLANGMEGNTYGVEIYAHYSVLDAWRLTGGVTAMRKDLETKPGVIDVSDGEAAGNDPAYRFVLRSLLTPLPSLELDVGVRGVDELETPAVSGYVELDARIGWHPREGLELFASAFNLLDDRRRQGNDAAAGFQIRRSFAAGMTFHIR